MRAYLTSDVDTYLKDITQALDFEQMEEFFNGHIRTEVTFEELVYSVATEGFEALNAEKICTFVFDTFFYELSVARPMFF